MPRQARLDAPGTLHQVILQGSERGVIVADAEDRAAFLRRLGKVVTATGTTLYAWTLLPNHAHLLLRAGPQGLALHAPAAHGVCPSQRTVRSVTGRQRKMIGWGLSGRGAGGANRAAEGSSLALNGT